MSFYENLGTVFVSGAFTLGIGHILHLRRQRKWKEEQRKWLEENKQAAIPLDFAVFKERMERLLDERENDHKDLAVSLIQLQRDVIGVRESIQWIRGKINGRGWKES